MERLFNIKISKSAKKIEIQRIFNIKISKSDKRIEIQKKNIEICQKCRNSKNFECKNIEIFNYPREAANHIFDKFFPFVQDLRKINQILDRANSIWSRSDLQD